MKGKLVDTWIYEYEGIPDGEVTVSPIKVPVKLYIHKKSKDSEAPPRVTKEVWFEVVCESPEFSLRGSDIECLRVAMWEQLDDHFKVKWERYFLVEIRPEHGYQEGISTGMVFTYLSVEKGTAWDGTLLKRQHNRYGAKIDPWPGEFKTHDGKTIACIPETSQNREALDQFGKRIDVLRERLAEFLRPERIMQTLTGLDTNYLLAGGRAFPESIELQSAQIEPSSPSDVP